MGELLASVAVATEASNDIVGTKPEQAKIAVSRTAFISLSGAHSAAAVTLSRESPRR